MRSISWLPRQKLGCYAENLSQIHNCSTPKTKFLKKSQLYDTHKSLIVQYATADVKLWKLSIILFFCLICYNSHYIISQHSKGNFFFEGKEKEKKEEETFLRLDKDMVIFISLSIFYYFIIYFIILISFYIYTNNQKQLFDFEEPWFYSKAGSLFFNNHGHISNLVVWIS